MHRSQGRASSQRLQAAAQFVHWETLDSANMIRMLWRLTAILTCFRFVERPLLVCPP